MIKEIYIDNFKCLTNFRINPGDFQLWLGDNGSGKTSVLHALQCLQQLMRGEHVNDIFNRNSLTTWETRSEQTIGITVIIDNEEYKYEITIEYMLNQEDRQRIKKETLHWGNSIFFQYDGQDAHLYRINRSTQEAEEGAVFPADWRHSMIPTIAQRDDNGPLILFREQLGKILIIQPVPLLVKDTAIAETRNLSKHAENFAQWYRHLVQEQPSVSEKAKHHLAEVFPGFEQLILREFSEGRKLKVTFRAKDKESCSFDFMDISDGQRQLIVLYIISEALRAGIFSTVLIDEPDNFVAIREIQPWIDNLNDICEEQNKQALIISHHPEIINKMARGTELWFYRKENGHTLTEPFPIIDGLTPAETMARGWEDE